MTTLGVSLIILGFMLMGGFFDMKYGALGKIIKRFKRRKERREFERNFGKLEPLPFRRLR